jgi:hypothetical protein
MSPEQKRKMMHALGLDWSERPYRNRYATIGLGDSDWDDLVERGLAVVAHRTKSQTIYGVTDEGISALGVMVLDGLEPSERYSAKTSPAP